MNASKTLLATLIPSVALALGACTQEAPPAPAPAPKAAKEEPKADAGRPMPPSAPTAAPAEGEKK